jgi:prepilin-type N-terminal cleavage/methylation domain-containing protein
MPDTCCHRGFSLIEITLGVVIIATITLVSVPNVSRLRQVYRLAAASNTVQSQLQYARIQAISKNTDHRMRVTGPTTYVLEHRFGGAWVVDRIFSLANGVSISATSATEFHARGNANPAGTFTLVNPRNEVRQVAVDTSGYIYAQ